ncbi:Cloroperoxidase [Ramaria rubella]|nr:Cloroperoxidase [Ramaria rubella]
MTTQSKITAITTSLRKAESPRCPVTGGSMTSLRGFPTSTEDSQSTLINPRIGTFQEPQPDHSRGPCPALNTLANHGYLHRDGHKITRKDLLAALRRPDTYNLSLPLAMVLVYGGFLMLHDPWKRAISLHDLARHNCVEHDASMVHKNTAPGALFAPIMCCPILLDELLKGHQPFTLHRVAQRRVELECVSSIDAVHQEVARGEWALVLDIFGRQREGKIPTDFMRVWLDQNEFPKGWEPHHKQGLIDTVRMSRRINKQMKKDRKEHKGSEKDCIELSKQLQSTLAECDIQSQRYNMEKGLTQA